jgi:hypothetical protein
MPSDPIRNDNIRNDNIRPEPVRPPPDRDRSVPELVTSALSQLSTLFRKEVQLARAEMSEKLGSMSTAAMPLAAGGGMLLAALFLLLLALSAWLATFMATGWALLIVGVVAAILGYALLRGGLSKLSASNLKPERTAEQLSRDAQVAKEQVR